ncbi:hypothetical protein [Streptomyces sp. NPDC051909]|uniref:hypothetical protein n=1 Tax=Streptomyces sp. NPDC051909 TaxID=3154944 RepID=UPI00341C94F8
MLSTVHPEFRLEDRRMVREVRTPAHDIEPAGTPESQVSMVVEDEAQAVLNKAHDLREAEITRLLMQPRRPCPPACQDVTSHSSPQGLWRGVARL